MNKTDRQILIELIKTRKGLFPYSIHKKLCLSPNAVYFYINRLKKMGMIEIDDDLRISITNIGRAYVIENNFYLGEGQDKEWRKCPVEYIAERHPINKPYVPSKSKLDKHFFNKDNRSG